MQLGNKCNQNPGVAQNTSSTEVLPPQCGGGEEATKTRGRLPLTPLTVK